MRGSIRLRITGLAMTVVTAVLVITGVALLTSQRRILTNNLDEILRTTSTTIERQYQTGKLVNPIVDQGDEDAIAQVVDERGNVLAGTSNLEDQPGLVKSGINGTTFRTIKLPIDESRYRLMSRSVNGIVIHTGTPIDDVDESVAALRTGLLVAIPAVALLLGVLVWWLVGRTLRPVELIRSQVAGITGAKLESRVTEPSANDEIARLARTMNAMLDRLEDTSRREQRFVADASHELRSPLTRMRAELDVDVAHPETADLLATHRSVLEEVDGLQRVVENLLQLARSEDGTGVTQRQVVDVDDLALAEAQRLRGSTHVEIDSSHVAAAQVVGNLDQLARVLRNLCDNAARYTTSRVALATREHDGLVEFTITDDGPGIPEHDRLLVFERFARIDQSREANSGGAGLGLAITLDIVQRHGGTIIIEEPEGGGARFVVSLPAATAVVST